MFVQLIQCDLGTERTSLADDARDDEDDANTRPTVSSRAG